MGILSLSLSDMLYILKIEICFSTPTYWWIQICFMATIPWWFKVCFNTALLMSCDQFIGTGLCLLSGVPDLWDRNKILRCGDLSHLRVPDCLWVFFYFVWFVFIHHDFQFYFELCTYCNILDIYLL